MSKHERSAGKHRKQFKPDGRLALAVRRMLTAVAVPSMIAGCAHQQPSSSAAQSGDDGKGRRIYHVLTQKDPLEKPVEPLVNMPPSPPVSTPIIENVLANKIAPPDGLQKRHSKRAGVRQPPLAARFRGKPRLIKELAKAPHNDAALPIPVQAQSILTGPVKPQTSPTALKTAVKPKKLRKNDPGWDQLRERLVLADIEHERVTALIEEFKRQPGNFEFLTRRAEPFLQYLLGEIDRRHLPPDLILVPMVESAFDPAAVSPKQAAGLWQFIPATGLQYGLAQVEGYDGRYDIHAATLAALAHLKHLVGLFKGDWLLALAAYNAGEGTVQRAIDANQKANLGTTFWELNLPGETRAYVPKIVAIAKLLAHPEDFGFKPRSGKSSAMLARIEVGPEIKMADVIGVAGMPAEEVFKFNPAFKADVDPPAGKTYSLLLPYDRAEVLAANLSGTKFLAARWIVVKKGETLSILAKRHGVPEIKLAEWNGLKPRQTLKAGQELVVFPV